MNKEELEELKKKYDKLAGMELSQGKLLNRDLPRGIVALRCRETGEMIVNPELYDSIKLDIVFWDGKEWIKVKENE
jgi:hypothetical protein